MEQLNARLLDKYNNLKKRKLFEEGWDQKRDAEITNFQSAVEDLIEELKSENERLFGELSALQEKYGNSEKLLLDEMEKTRELSSEVRRLQVLLSQKNENDGIAPMTVSSTTPEGGSIEAGLTSGVGRSPSTHTVKMTKISESPQKTSPNSFSNHDDVQNKESANNAHNTFQEKQNMPACCCIRSRHSSEDGVAKGPTMCVLHSLVEILVGVKLSVGVQREDVCLSIVHEKSGYTFSLTMVRHESGGCNLMYRVSSLGTLERIALDWMKEDLIFSLTMCPVFFERISRVIGRG